MAHFAKIENNIVTQVIVIDNNDCCGGDFPNSEICGQNFIRNIGLDGLWKQTSYNSNFRKNYAGIGYPYNEQYDLFLPPQPFSSWNFDNNTLQWEAPVPYPNDNKNYYWDETNLIWKEI